uniref:Retrovirus-related Pol polyprotein from transposon TNT 1-94 n=1 Tax=Tanacetum cinerariifolium TaxID=118510 RepID=A0A6L2M6X8_TANCI|nr:retrovirus-related Pol polyprotein from transposon TNT 1-94 [Tanacetum cinerariifolium]
MLYEKSSKTWNWWIGKQCPSGYIWKPEVKNDNALTVDSLPLDIESRFTADLEPLNKMGPNLSNSPSSSNSVADHTNHHIHRVNHNLFSVGQLCDAYLEVAFKKLTCFVRDLYTIALLKSSSPTLICFMAKASPTQAWLGHRRLSHLNFDTINLLSKNGIVNGLLKVKYVKDHLCSSCEMNKAKRSTFKTKTVPSSKGWLHLLHMDLCGLMRVDSINGKKYILVIVDDYSRYTWTHFLRSKDETSKNQSFHQQVSMLRKNTDQTADAQFEAYDFIIPFAPPGTEAAEYSSRNDSGFELNAFSDADHAGCLDTHKSTSGGIQFLGEKIVTWMSKNQDYTAMSTAQAKYVALSSAIAISCNPVEHFRTNHINVH